jgi:hypothetical protein
MTPAQHDQLRHESEATAALQLTRYAAMILRDALPREDPARSQCVLLIEQKLLLAKADYFQLTFPETDPATSDLRAALFQEAFDRLAADFLAGIGQ